MVNTRLLLTLIITFIAQYNPLQAMFGVGCKDQKTIADETGILKAGLKYGMFDNRRNQEIPKWLHDIESEYIEDKKRVTFEDVEHIQQSFAALCSPEARVILKAEETKETKETSAQVSENKMFKYVATCIKNRCQSQISYYKKHMDQKLLNTLGKLSTAEEKVQHLTNMIMKDLGYLYLALSDRVKKELGIEALCFKELIPLFLPEWLKEGIAPEERFVEALRLVPPQQREAASRMALRYELNRAKILKRAGTDPVKIEQPTILLQYMQRSIKGLADAMAKDGWPNMPSDQKELAQFIRGLCVEFITQQGGFPAQYLDQAAEKWLDEYAAEVMSKTTIVVEHKKEHKKP